MKEQKQEVIEIQPIRIRKFLMTIKSISNLICNRRSPDRIKPNAGHEFNEDEEFRSSLYPKVGENGNYGFPAAGLKKCGVQAAGTFLKSIKKNVAQGSFFIPVEFVEIVSKQEPQHRRDVVTVQKNAVVRNRAEFNDWEITFPIEFSIVGKMTPEQLVNLFNVAGNCIGIGDWRPQKGGIFGRFIVTAIQELK
jgi:hypothetical protein